MKKKSKGNFGCKASCGHASKLIQSDKIRGTSFSLSLKNENKNLLFIALINKKEKPIPIYLKKKIPLFIALTNKKKSLFPLIYS